MELRRLLICRIRKVSTRVSSYLSDLKLTGCARRYLMKIVAYMGFRQRRPCIDVQRTPIYVCIVSHVTVCLDGPLMFPLMLAWTNGWKNVYCRLSACFPLIHINHEKKRLKQKSKIVTWSVNIFSDEQHIFFHNLDYGLINRPWRVPFRITVML